MGDLTYCPQHGYPLPCTKCGLGEYERAIKLVVDWIEKNHKSFHYALINGGRKEDTYSIYISDGDWQAFKKEHGLGD